MSEQLSEPCVFSPIYAASDPQGQAKTSAQNNITSRPAICNQEFAARRLCHEQGISKSEFIEFICIACLANCVAQCDLANNGPSSQYAKAIMP